MCRAIADAYEVDEVKQIHDKVRAIEMYARQVRNVEAERQACEIRLRKERHRGQMLRAMEKAKGGQPYHCLGSFLVSVGAVCVLPFRYETRILLISLKKCP